MTAVPPSLSAQFRDSFSYFTLRDRLPIIVTKIIDQLHRDKNILIDKFGNTCGNDVKEITGRLAKLKNEMQTDKPLFPFDSSDFPDIVKWTQALDDVLKVTEQSTWFSAPWLFIENYMYQRIFEAFNMSNNLKDFDYFQKQKEDAMEASRGALVVARQHLANALNDVGNMEQIRAHLSELLKISLWSNQCDLSLSSTANPIDALQRLQSFIIVDNSNLIVEHILKLKELKPDGIRIDFILDNAGFELFCDLCLAHFLCATNLAKEIYFYVKCIPWYVSDTTANDFAWTLNILKTYKTHNNEATMLPELAKVWQKYVTDNVWRIQKEYFWTQPFSFSEMKDREPSLYKKLAEADLTIFKGDLNYRKLTGDRNWDPTTLFETALRGFHPSPLATLRTLKADLVVGLKPGQAEEIVKQCKDWMTTGEYAVIQFCEKIIS